MFKFVTLLFAVLAFAAAKPSHLSPATFAASPALAYSNAPLYAAGGGSNQIDVRHNYDGTLSSYTTTPFHYSGPYSNRYVARAPAHFAGPSVAAPGPFAAPAKYLSPSGLSSPYALPPHGVHYASPFAAQYSSPYASYASGGVSHL